MHEGLTLDNKHTLASYNLLDLHEKPYVVLKFVAIKRKDGESESKENTMRNIWVMSWASHLLLEFKGFWSEENWSSGPVVQSKVKFDDFLLLGNPHFKAVSSQVDVWSK